MEVRNLLRQATALDPSSADLAYRRARAHDELDETDAAVQWYCRYLALAPEEGDQPEVSARLRELGEGVGPSASETAMEAFREGVDQLERGNAAAAEDRFTEALEADRGLAEARYNRGLARGSLGRSREAVVDFRAYLAARPDAPDRTEVAGAARFLERSRKRYDPIWAAALGTLVPGAGHFYTGRPVGGGILLGGAVAAGLAGALYERVEIRCRTAPENGFCPEDQIHSRTSERPGLVPGMVGVALAAAVSAVTAYRGAVDRNGESVRLRIAGHESRARDGDGLRVGPPVLAHAPGGVELRILNLRF